MTTPDADQPPEPQAYVWAAPRDSPRRRKFRAVFGRIALAGIIFLAGVGFANAQAADRNDGTGLNMIADAWDLLHQEYVDAANLDSDTLAYGAIKGMAEAVGDTGHTYFLTPDEASLDTAMMSGPVGLIGVWLDDPRDITLVTYVDPNGPAGRAGISAGDRIVEVDGDPTAGPDGVKALDHLVGTPGIGVLLTIERPGQPKPIKYRVLREEFQNVTWAVAPGTNIGVLRFRVFSDGSAKDLAMAAVEAKNAGVDGLVLDLRGNPGGVLDEALLVAGVFLPSGTVVEREIDQAGTETEKVVPPDRYPTKLPLVVLVDGDSASSSEVVAGALHDTDRATIVGTRTGGLGTILSAWDYDDGSVFWIGTSRWVTPSGTSVWHVGFDPDVAVALPAGVAPLAPEDFGTAEELSASGDEQLLRALDLLNRD